MKEHRCYEKIKRRNKRELITTIYSHQKQTSRRRGHNSPTYTKQEFLDFALSSPKFHELYDQWVESGYKKSLSPSFDRADDYKGYSFENFNAWMPWKDNKQKYRNDVKDGINNKKSKAVIGTHKISGEIIQFYSAEEAGRQTGVDQSNILKCCIGIKRKSAGGYVWKLKSETINVV